MKNSLISIGILLPLLSTGSAWADDSCSAVALYSDEGAFESCQITNGENISFLEVPDTTEESCQATCAFMSEINAMAAESRELDTEAGF